METEAPMTISKNQLLTKSLLYGLVLKLTFFWHQLSVPYRFIVFHGSANLYPNVGTKCPSCLGGGQS